MGATLKLSQEKFVRYLLSVLLLLVAINAFGGGYYGILGAEDIPIEWLKGSPFHNYLIPSIILFVCVGGSALFAAFAVFRKHHLGHKAAFVCSIMLIIWISVQLAIIGFVSWLQPAIVIAAIVIFTLTWLLPKYDT